MGVGVKGSTSVHKLATPATPTSAGHRTYTSDSWHGERKNGRLGESDKRNWFPSRCLTVFWAPEISLGHLQLTKWRTVSTSSSFCHHLTCDLRVLIPARDKFVSSTPLRGEKEVAVQLHSVPSPALEKCVFNVTLRPLYPHKINAVPIELKAGWTPQPIWTCLDMRKPPLIGIRIPFRPARSLVAVMPTMLIRPTITRS